MSKRKRISNNDEDELQRLLNVSGFRQSKGNIFYHQKK